MEISDDILWKLIDIYFQDNPQALVRHHIDSYNDFIQNGIQQIFRETNPLKLELQFDKDKNVQDFRSKAHLYFGGKDGSKVYIGKPTIQDEGNPHYMFPNECRLRNMTYGLTVHYDLEIEFSRILGDNDTPTVLDEKGSIVFECDYDDETDLKNTNKFTPNQVAKMKEKMQNTMQKQNVQVFCMKLEKLYLGKFPIMVQSDFCILQGMPRELRQRMGECKNDVGAYFIIDGKEKTVVCQEKFGDNMLYIRKSKNETLPFTYSAEIRSVSENVSKPIRTLKIQIMNPTSKRSNNNIVVLVPNVRVPVPLFILFRALGIITDREIMSMCTFQNPEFANPQIADILSACVHDAGNINSQAEALKLLSLYIKGQTITKLLHILADYFLPHVGEVNFLDKAYHLGYMVHRLLMVATGVEEPTDRDNYKFKRLELIGPMMKDLFREYYKKQQHHIRLSFERIYDPSQAIYSDISTLIYRNYKEVFREKIVEKGFQKAFKGDWGAEQHTKRIGVTQDLNRLSHNGMMSHLRKTNLPLDTSVKLVGPRLLHNTQWGLIDPIDTPDGANIGLHKHLAILTHVTSDISREPLIAWLKKYTNIKSLNTCISFQLMNVTKVFVNGLWCGVSSDPLTLITELKLHRRHGLIPVTVSISFQVNKKEILIFTDSGRLCRPLFYKDEISNKFIFETNKWKPIVEYLNKEIPGKWNHIICGFHEKNSGFNPTQGKIYDWEQLYKLPKTDIQNNKALLEYIDSNESENLLIAINTDTLLQSSLKYTHFEIHESTMFGILCNLVNFPENNPATRNSFSCGQSKQAASLYSTNYQVRMDKNSVILNNGQIPLVKSRYMQYINNEENPYGENAIVAVMCYTGYNVEDAILINEGALHRGLFRTTYFTTYEAHEEKEIKREKITKESVFTNIESVKNIVGTKEGYDYSLLDEHGIIRENVEVNDKTILLGISDLLLDKDARKDSSKKPKKGQVGVVDKVFMTDGEEGQRIAKVRIREERIPNVGDKFASRAGQKGTIGMVIPEEDMPYTKNGLRPDIIINPHALPSRMTIGQIIECITGKVCSLTGTFGDCTAYTNSTSRIGLLGEILTTSGFHSTGNEIMYNGMTGGQIDSEIFIGPTYYMRLKHMVKDKINYRDRGPRNNLTRQAVSGRANDGGLRIGEMERDAIISHGASYFLQESMMKRGDEYKMAICNQTGMIAIYNPTRNLLLSPMADGPLKYTGSLMTRQQEVQQFTRFGRKFSLVEVPYSLKLLIQELQAINVRVSIITEDNISQIDNMGFSNNIDLMLNQKNATVADLISTINKNINKAEDKPKINKKNIEQEAEPSKSPMDMNTQNSPVFTYDTITPESHISKTSPVAADMDNNSPEYGYVSPVLTPKLFDNNPELQEYYETMKPKYKDRIKLWSTVDQQLYVKHMWNKAQERLQNKNLADTTTGVQKGGKVHCRGDTKPQREWVIDKVGNNLYGIYTTDTENLETEDTYKYVTPNDVYPLGDYVFVNETDYTNDDDVDDVYSNQFIDAYKLNQDYSYDQMVPMDMNDIANPPLLPLDNAKTNIHFNPIIKVITDGNDYSQGQDLTTTASTAAQNVNPLPNSVVAIPDTNQDTNQDVNFSKPIIVKKQ